MGVLTAALLILGVPQVIRSAGRLAAGIDSTEEVPPASLKHAAEQAEALDKTLSDPQGSLRGGLLRLKLALAADGSVDKRELEQAAADLEKGLARAPANGQGWAALSHADLVLDRPDAAAKALSTGLFASQADPFLNPSWCVLGIALWSRLNSADRARIAEEVEWAWRDRRPLLLAVGRADPHSSTLLRNILDETEKAEFDLLLQDGGGR